MNRNPARQPHQFASIAEFNAAGGASAYGDGPVWIAGELFWCDGGVSISESGRPISLSTEDVPPIYDIAMTSLESTVTRNGAAMTVGGSRAINRIDGTRLEWDSGLGLADGNFIAVTYIFPSPIDISELDRLMFEFSHDNNWIDTRLQIIVSGANDLVNTSRFIYQAIAHSPSVALMLLKSDFSTFTGTGVNWSNLTRIDFRFTKHTADNANQRARMDLHRLAIGQYTKPKILFTVDDNATELYEIFKRHESKKITPDVFVTDYEIATENNWASTLKCTIAQNMEMQDAGYRFYPHNIDHRAYSHTIEAVSRSGDTVTITIGGYGSISGSATDMLPIAGEFIAIDWHRSEQLNGIWEVDSITAGTSATNSTIVITVPGASFPDDSVANGGTVTVLKYDYIKDVRLLRQMIKRAGLATNDRYLAYTGGRNSLTVHERLSSEAGIVLARATANVPHSFPEANTAGVMQIDRKYGRGGQSTRFFSIITNLLTNAAALQTLINRLIATGGLLSIFTHGDDISEANIDAIYELLYSYAQAGTIDIIQMHELEAIINGKVS